MAFRHPVQGLAVRPACEADLDAVEAVAAAVWPEVEAFVRRRCGCAEQFAAECRGLSAWMLAAEHRGQVAGFLAWRQDETVGVVQAHAVLPGHRDLGIGTALLAGLVARVRREGLRIVEATLPASFRTARRIYERQGFREQGRSAREGEPADVWVHYERRFKSP